MTMTRTILAAIVALGTLGTAHAEGEDTMLVLDASNSMWGQIDGVNKIVIAKDVLEGLLYRLPEERRLGLVAYGHRRKGDCEDIETLADVGAARNDLRDQVRGLTPRGKTPLSASVAHAAEALGYTERKSTVILVSDGIETCDFDPCELARTLEENGVDFTVHVIGFDVRVEDRATLQCLATETGGTFLAASDADELSDALTSVTQISTPPEPQVRRAGSKPGCAEGDDPRWRAAHPKQGRLDGHAGGQRRSRLYRQRCGRCRDRNLARRLCGRRHLARLAGRTAERRSA